MYAELLEQLDAVEGQLPLAAVSHIKPKDRGMDCDKDKEKQQERERQKEREKAQAAKAQLAARGGLYVLICCISSTVMPMFSVLVCLWMGLHSTLHGPNTPGGPCPLANEVIMWTCLQNGTGIKNWLVHSSTHTTDHSLFSL